MKRIFKLTSIIMLGDLAARLISILYLVPLMWINPQTAELITILIIPFAFFIVVSNLGINTVLTISITKNYHVDDDKNRTNLYIANSLLLASATFFSVLMFFMADNLVAQYALSEVAETKMIIATKFLSSGILIFAILGITRTILVSMGEYAVRALGTFLEQLIKVIIVLALSYIFIVKRGYGYENVVYYTAFGTVVSMLVIIMINLSRIIKCKYYKMYTQGNLNFTVDSVKFILFSSLIFIASTLYISAFDMIDLLLFDDVAKTLVNSPSDVSYFADYRLEYMGMAKKLVLIPIQLTDGLILVMIRELANKENKKAQFNDVLVLTYTLSLVAIGGLLVLGDDLYFLLSSIESIGVLKLQAFIIVFYTIKNITSGYFLTFEGFEKALISSMAVLIGSKVFFLLTLDSFVGINIFIVSTVLSLILGIGTLFIVGREFLAFNRKMLVNIIITTIKAIIITIFYMYVYSLFALDILLVKIFIIGILMVLTYAVVMVPNKFLKRIIRIG